MKTQENPTALSQKFGLAFGMPTLIEAPDAADCAALCGELGLSFVELNMNLPQYQIGTMPPDTLLHLADKAGIFYTIHLDENCNPFDFNPAVSEAYSQTVLDTIALAKRLQVPILNLHLSTGVYFTLPEQRVYLFAAYRSAYLAKVRAFRDSCERAIGSADIKIAIENCDGYTDFQREAIALLLESPVFGLTFDIGHNHGCGGADTDVIHRYEDRLCHMHMHDASGKKNHLPLGMGDLPLADYLALAQKRHCRVVLETKTIQSLRQSVAYLHNL